VIVPATWHGTPERAVDDEGPQARIGDDGCSASGPRRQQRVEALADDRAAKPYESLEPDELEELTSSPGPSLRCWSRLGTNQRGRVALDLAENSVAARNSRLHMTKAVDTNRLMDPTRSAPREHQPKPEPGSSHGPSRQTPARG